MNVCNAGPTCSLCFYAMLDGADVFSVRNRKVYASRMMHVLLGGLWAERSVGRRHVGRKYIVLGGESSQCLLATFHFARNL